MSYLVSVPIGVTEAALLSGIRAQNPVAETDKLLLEGACTGPEPCLVVPRG